MRDEQRLRVGQVLWLKLQFERGGEFSLINHPYLIINIDDGIEIAEVLQFDSLKGREYYLFNKGNIKIDAEDETVISEDSYIQLGKVIKLQIFEQLENFRKTTDLISRNMLERIMWNREEYLRYHDIEDKNILYFTEEQILSHNNL